MIFQYSIILMFLTAVQLLFCAYSTYMVFHLCAADVISITTLIHFLNIAMICL